MVVRRSSGLLAWAALAACAAAAAEPLPDLGPRIGAAYRALDAGRAEEALRRFQDVQRADPANLEAREGVVWSYWKLGDLERAARAADERRALAPGDARWAGMWVEIVAALPARRAEAIAVARDLAAAKPGDAALHARLAEILLAEGRDEEALAERRTAAAAAPRDGATQRGLAQALARAGAHEEALKIADGLLARDRGDRAAMDVRVWALAALGRSEEAARAADARLALDPADAAWRDKWMGLLAAVPSRRKEAVDAARADADARPADPAARQRVGRLLLQADDAPGAVVELRRALALAPADRALRRDLARALAAAGGLDEAVTLLDGLLAETPADPEALLERARIARWWGAFATARDLLRRAAAAAPRDPAVRAEQERTEAEARPFDGIAPPAGMRGVLERYAGAGLPLVAGMLLLALVLAYRGRAGDAAVGLTVAALALAGAWFAFFGSAR